MAHTDLRPMSLGEVLDRTFSLYKNNFWLFVGIAALAELIVVAFNELYTLLLNPATPPPTATLTLRLVLVHFGVALAELALMVVVDAIVYAAAQAATAVAVSDLYMGRMASVRGSYARVRRRIFSVLLVAILTYLMVGLGLIFVIPGIYLLGRMALAIPALALEDIGPLDAIGRSFRLAEGSEWGNVAVFVLVLFFGLISQFVFHLPDYLTAALPLSPHALSSVRFVLGGLEDGLSGVVVGPVATIAFSLIYYNQRVRKEALDIEHLMASLPANETPREPSLA